MASSSRARSSSPFSHRKLPSPYSSTLSTSSSSNQLLMPRSCSSTATSFYNSSAGGDGGFGPGPRSTTPSHSRSDSAFYGNVGGYESRSPVGFAADELMVELVDAPQSADSISVTIRFRPLR